MSPSHGSLGVSVVATVFNESANIDRLLDSLAAQLRPPDEMVAADGGSGDGTLERLTERAARGDLPFSLVVLTCPGANISAGRNRAIGAARGPVIAVTDAGVRLEPDWLAALVAPIEEGAAKVASGFFASDPHGAFETALGATTLPEVSDVKPAGFLPSSRSVAFLKDAWAAAGGYPEWLDYCEDLVFDLRLFQVAGPGVFVPQAIARFRPRTSLAAFFRQYYLYARGDGKAGLWPRRHLVRYATYGVAIPGLIGLADQQHPAWWLVLAAGLAAMVATPFRRLTHQWQALNAFERIQAAMWIPVIRYAGDVAKMVGYPVGLAWRWRHDPPEWRAVRPLGDKAVGG